MLCKILVFGKMPGLVSCHSRGFGQIANTQMSWICAGSISLEKRLEEVEVGRVVGKETVQVPSGGVLLIKNAVYVMAPEHFWTKAQCTTLHLEPSKM